MIASVVAALLAMSVTEIPTAPPTVAPRPAVVKTMAPRPLPARVAGVPVLMYHKVDAAVPADAIGRSLTVDPAAFAAQLAWLRDHGIRTVTLAELTAALQRGERPRGVVVLTFDDGYADAATVVTPLLQRFGARASFYVSAGFIGDGRHVSWPQLRAMRAAGMEIGCHGTFHRDLAAIRPADAAYEVNHCASTLAHYLAAPETYAYAAGKWTPTIELLVRDAHFRAALTEEPGTVDSLAHRFELPRRRVDRSTGLAAFGSLATP